MEENFEKIYADIEKLYGEKYKSKKSKIKPKTMLMLFGAMLIFSFISTFVKNFGYADSYIYSILQLISVLLTVIIAILAFVYTNQKMNYWKYAYSFKNEVGKFFFHRINEKIEYRVDRASIDQNVLKDDLEKLYSGSNILEVADCLSYNNIKSYTLKFNDAKMKRYNGVLLVFDNCKNIDNIENWKKNLQFSKEFEIINAGFDKNKLYLFFDAAEVFKYNSNNFISKKELYSNYKFFNELIQIGKFIV